MNTIKVRIIAAVIMVAILVSFAQISALAAITDSIVPSNTTVEDSISSTEALSNKTLDTKDIPLHINAKNAEEKGHIERLRTEEKDLYSAVFRNIDGTQTVYFFGTPIKYVDDNGMIKDISTEITNIMNVKNNKSYQYAVTENRFKQYYSNNSDVGVLLEAYDYSIQMIPVGSSRMTINNASVINNTVCYADVFGSDTTVRYTPTSTGIKEDIILESCPDSNAFSFILYTDGLMVESINEKLYLVNKDEIIVADLGEVLVYDSNGLYGSGDMSFEAIKDNYAYAVTITVDESYLNSNKTSYPVIVDPTLTIYEIDVIGEDHVYGDLVDGKAIEDLCIHWWGRSPIPSDSTTYLTDIGNYYYEEYYDEDDQVLVSNNHVSHMLYRIVEDYWDWNPLSAYLSDDQCESVTLHVSGSVAGSGVTVIAYPYEYTWTDGISNRVVYNHLNIGSENTSTTYLRGSGELEIDITNVANYWSTADYSTRDKGLALAVLGEGDGADSELNNRVSIYQTENTNPSNDVYITVTYWARCADYFDPELYRIYKDNICDPDTEDIDTYLTSSPYDWSVSVVYSNARYLMSNAALGTQLWSIQKINSYDYIIVSSYHRSNADSEYIDNIVLTYDSEYDYLKCDEYDGSDYQIWRIYKHNGAYRIVNKSDLSKMLNLSAIDGQRAFVSDSACDLIIAEASDLLNYAPVYDIPYNNGFSSYGINIKITIDASAIFGSVTQSLVECSVQTWESCSRKINIYVPSEYNNNEGIVPSNSFEISVAKIDLDTAKNMSNKITEKTAAYWDSGEKTIFLIEENMIDITDILDLKSIIVHEMGHVFQLSHHDESGLGKDKIVSAMNSGTSSSNSYMSAIPSAFDIWMVHERWGL